MERRIDTDDYRDATEGEGPHAFTWIDKPHRLIYDLCREIDRLRDEGEEAVNIPPSFKDLLR